MANIQEKYRVATSKYRVATSVYSDYTKYFHVSILFNAGELKSYSKYKVHKFELLTVPMPC